MMVYDRYIENFYNQIEGRIKNINLKLKEIKK